MDKNVEVMVEVEALPPSAQPTPPEVLAIERYTKGLINRDTVLNARGDKFFVYFRFANTPALVEFLVFLPREFRGSIRQDRAWGSA